MFLNFASAEGKWIKKKGLKKVQEHDVTMNV